MIGGFIRTLLERDGHHVQVFANGLEIDDILKTDALTGTDVFLLDICVPGRSGLEVGRLIREKNPDSKIVFYSALSDIETVQESFRLNNRTQFLRKPFKKEELIEMLELVMSAEA